MYTAFILVLRGGILPQASSTEVANLVTSVPITALGTPYFTCLLFPVGPSSGTLCSNQIRDQPCRLSLILPAECSRWRVRWRPATATATSTSERQQGRALLRPALRNAKVSSPTRFCLASDYPGIPFGFRRLSSRRYPQRRAVTLRRSRIRLPNLRRRGRLFQRRAGLSRFRAPRRRRRQRWPRVQPISL